MEGLNAFEYLSSSGETRKLKKSSLKNERNIFFQKITEFDLKGTKPLNK